MNMDEEHVTRAPRPATDDRLLRRVVSPPRRPPSGLDEGYIGGCEETRSPSDSDASMQVDAADLDVEGNQGDTAHEVRERILTLPKSQRASIAASLIASLPGLQQEIAFQTLVAALSAESNLGRAPRSRIGGAQLTC